MTPLERQIVAFRPLVHRIAASAAGMRHPLVEREDLEAVGMVAAWRAIEGYDESRGVKLSTWVAMRVQWAIRHELRRYRGRHGRGGQVETVNNLDMDWHATTHDDHEAPILRRRLLRLVARLRPARRAAVHAVYLERNAKEISRARGITAQAIYVAAAQGVAQLRRWCGVRATA